MGQEFIIKSQKLEDKVNQLLPSQGGFQAGVDLSASTTVIPIVDLTESAEGSSLRLDLQTSLDFASEFNSVSNTTTTLVTTTGFYRVFGISNVGNDATSTNFIFITDGVTDKKIFQDSTNDGSVNRPTTCTPFDFNVFLSAGISLRATSNNTASIINVATRQIADIAGNLTNPLNF